MGKYRLAFYWKAQIGILIGFNRDFIYVHILCVKIMVGLGEAKGVRFFKD